MQIRVLGGIEAAAEDGRALGGPTQRRLLALRNYDTDTWSDIACEVAGRNLTEDEWDQVGPRSWERRATCEQYPL